MKKLSVGIALVFIVVACGDSALTTTSAAPAATTSTTLAATTTTASTTTTTQPATTTTTTTVAATTTTVPPPEFRFRPDGLGLVDFGATPDEVLPVMIPLFGDPLRDTGWVDEPICPGSMNRFIDFGVDWGDFQLMFTTEGLFAPEGTGHFYSYRYNGATPVPVSPPELTVGTKVSELQALYPSVYFEPNPFLVDVTDYHVDGPGAEKLYGKVSGTSPGDVVLSVQGGIGCGE